MRLTWHDVALFVVSGASVAALAMVSISPPVDATKIALITFGSLTAAIAAPMLESTIRPQAPRPGTNPGAGPLEQGRVHPVPGDAGAAAPVDYGVLVREPVETPSVLGRREELMSLQRRLVKQQKDDRSCP